MQFHPQHRPRKLRRKHQDTESTSSPAPQSGKVERVLQLQRTIGNKATQSVLQREMAHEDAVTTPQSLLEQGGEIVKSDPDGAMALYQQALRMKTATPLQKAKLLYNIGVCYLKMDETLDALEYFGKALALGEVDPVVYKAILKGHSKARKYVNEDYDPDDLYHEGVELLEERNFAEAINRFSTMLNMFNNVPNELRGKATYNLGVCYYRESKYRLALSKFEEALAVGSLSPEVVKFIKNGIRKAKMKSGMKHHKAHKKINIF